MTECKILLLSFLVVVAAKDSATKILPYNYLVLLALNILGSTITVFSIFSGITRSSNLVLMHMLSTQTILHRKIYGGHRHFKISYGAECLILILSSTIVEMFAQDVDQILSAIGCIYQLGCLVPNTVSNLKKGKDPIETDKSVLLAIGVFYEIAGFLMILSRMVFYLL